MDTCLDVGLEDYMVTDGYIVGKPVLCSYEHALVKRLVTKHRIVVFSKSTCPHCENSKLLLKRIGVSFVSLELDQLKEGHQLQDALDIITGAKTVPRIFIDGKCIGGCNDLTKLNNSGKLKDLLKDFV